MSASRQRLDAIDLVRGLVIVLMALDHTKDFFQSFGEVNRATDIERTTPALFFTRWVTHFCAPTFVFLAGTGAFLGLKRGRAALAVFLLTRGLWLAVLELTLVHCLWFLNGSYENLPLQVIWAIGTSMMLLAFFVWLPPWTVGLMGVAVIAGHNWFDWLTAARVTSATGSPTLGGLWAILHSPEPIWVNGVPNVLIFPAYPVLPWFGVMAAGYGAGALWRLEPVARRMWLASLGVLATLAFVVIRGLNGYGDPKPWDEWTPTIFSGMACLNCTKYPPSLDYCLMTLGPALIALAVFDVWNGGIGRPLVTFGRVPLFFYLIHLPAIQLAAAVVVFVGIRIGWYESFAAVRQSGLGFGLPGVYLAWAVIIFALYWPCRWFAGVKAQSRAAWLSYI